MQKFLARALISVLLLLTLGLIPGFADDEGEIEPLSPAFLEWQSKKESESDLPSSKNAMPGENDSGGYIPFPVDLSHLAENPPDESSPYPNRKASTLPEAFDLRNVDGKSYVTSVKNQNPYGTCWAHAALGAMESNMLMQDLGTYDLSEMHIAWYAFRGNDKSAAFYNMHSSSFATVMAHGGNSFYPAAVFTRLSGPANESEVPYGQNKQPTAGSPDDYTRAARVREIYYLCMGSEPNVNASASARDIIKRRIMETGAVVANYYSNNAGYYKSPSAGTNYYYNSSTTNHAVQIIGWDDNYSRSNFKTKPSVDGAWLIKNSWGDTWWNGSSNVGDNGCFWMSYAQHLTEGSAFITEKADSKMKAYYYDALGWCSTWGYNSGISSIHAANVFKAERDGETLTEVGIITPDNNVSYEIKIYAGMSSMPTSSPIPSGNSAVSSASGKFAYAGYHTVTLDTPVTLSEGEYFSVVVTFGNYSKVAVERVVSSWSPNAVIDEGSFFSANGSFWFTGKSQSINATIKAFTVSGTVTGTAPRINDGYPEDAYTNQSYSYTLSASGTKPVTWSASGNIPAELAIDSDTGEISGTPTTEGSYTFSVTAKNSYGSDTKSYTINVWDVPKIDAEEITGYLGYSMSHQMKLTPSVSATWSTTDKLPAGLSLSRSGLISGKPTKAGTYSATLKAVTTAGTSEAAVKFVINTRPVKPSIRISSLRAGTVGEEFSHDIEATGTEPITITIQGQPDGISLNGSTVYMSGTPTTAGTYSIKITAENIATQLENRPVTKTVRFTVKARKPVINAPESLPDAIMGEDYGEHEFTLSDGTAPITWRVSGQPSGMRMSSSGTLSGRPTRAGKFNLTVRATNSGGYDTVRLPLVVLQKPTITTARMSNATTDRRYTARLSAKGSTPMSWDIDGLPDTMTFTQNAAGTSATITGTPVDAEDYELKVKVSNEAGETESTITFRVAGVAPRLTASLPRAKVGQSYESSRIYATGTKPIGIMYSIPDSELAKFGVSSLSELGLVFSNDPENGTASITGTPEISVKNLPITFSATNPVSSRPVTKRVNLTIAGQRPVFTLPEESSVNITCEVNSEIALDFQTEGTKHITYSMNKVNGFTLTQTGDYDATLTGTAPARDSTTTLTITASNADGKSTKRVVIKTQTPPKITAVSSGTLSGGSTALNGATLKKKYSVRFTATGTRTIRWKFEGTLPDGMSFSSGTLSGTPREAGTFSFKLTAYNAIGEDTKEFTLSVVDPDNGSLPAAKNESSPAQNENVNSDSMTQNENGESESASQNDNGESESQASESNVQPSITFGGTRLTSPNDSELNGKGYTVAAVLPEISVNVSGMYDIEATLYENIPEGAELLWFAYPEESGKSDDDEIAEFYDEAGAEILTVPSSRKIVVSVWLNEGVKYCPVIAVK